MLIKQVEVGRMLNYAYIIADPESKEGIVIDPSWEPDELFDIASKEGIKIKYIVNTHCHEDHVNGNRKMKEVTGAQIAIHEEEAKYLKHFFPPEPDIRLKSGDIITIGSVRIEVVHTPGHSPGSICLKAGDNLFTGDTLFVGSCGRTDLPGGDAAIFSNTMRMLSGMDDAINVYPGHNYGATPVSSLGLEKKYNPCLSI